MNELQILQASSNEVAQRQGQLRGTAAGRWKEPSAERGKGPAKRQALERPSAEKCRAPKMAKRQRNRALVLQKRPTAEKLQAPERRE